MQPGSNSAYSHEETDADRKRSILTENALSLDLVFAFSGDRELTESENTRFEILKDSRGLRLYSDLLYAITHQFFPPEIAVHLWNEIQQHKSELSDVLGRKVKITVATLDYLSNIRPIMFSTTLAGEAYIDELIGLSLRDGLTKLFNHTFFAEEIELEITRYQRYQFAVSLAFIDIDDFKQVNDVFGHQKGDVVLATMGKTLSDIARKSDVCCRYGGEEFAVIFPLTDICDAEVISKRIQSELKYRLPNDKLVTVSIGLASTNEKVISSQQLIEMADKALYQAKRTGKNRLVIES